jgi:hypothetical protein
MTCRCHGSFVSNDQLFARARIGPLRADEQVDDQINGRFGSPATMGNLGDSVAHQRQLGATGVFHRPRDEVFERCEVVRRRCEREVGARGYRSVPDRIETTLEQKLSSGRDQRLATTFAFGCRRCGHLAMVPARHVPSIRNEQGRLERVLRFYRLCNRCNASAISAVAPANENRTVRVPLAVSKSTPGASATPVSASTSRHHVVESSVRWPMWA